MASNSLDIIGKYPPNDEGKICDTLFWLATLLIETSEAHTLLFGEPGV